MKARIAWIVPAAGGLLFAVAAGNRLPSSRLEGGRPAAVSVPATLAGEDPRIPIPQASGATVALVPNDVTGLDSVSGVSGSPECFEGELARLKFDLSPESAASVDSIVRSGMASPFQSLDLLLRLPSDPPPALVELLFSGLRRHQEDPVVWNAIIDFTRLEGRDPRRIAAIAILGAADEARWDQARGRLVEIALQADDAAHVVARRALEERGGDETK